MTGLVQVTGAMQQDRARALSATRTVMVSTFWNLFGRAGPILIALAATPILVRDLGMTRWGVFTIALSLVGMFGIFDFGFGRAMTRSIAERIGAGEEASAASLVVTGMLAMSGLGVLGGGVAALAATWWVRHGLHIGAAQQREVLYSFYVLSASAPFVILSAAMWGVVCAYQKFRVANLVGLPLQALYYVGPLLMLRVWDSLIGVMLVLLLCRVAFAAIYWMLCLRMMPTLRGARPNFAELRPLLRLGGWMSVSNITWPVLMYADRFVIATVLTAAATAYYTTPFDVISRLAMVSIAVMASAFPAMALSFRSDPGTTAALFRRSLLAIGSLLFPLCLLVASFSGELMAAWLGHDFAAQSAPLLRWLIVGAWLTSIDGATAGLIDAIGRPDLNAKLSLAELALSIPVLLVLLTRFGIEGAAVTWVLRCCINFAARLLILARCYQPVRQAIRQIIPTAIAATLLLLSVPGAGVMVRAAAAGLALLVYLAVLWRCSLSLQERALFATTLQRMIRAAPGLGRPGLGRIAPHDRGSRTCN